MQEHDFWQEGKELNSHLRFWRPPCYHYTTDLCGGENNGKNSPLEKGGTMPKRTSYFGVKSGT